MINLGTCGNQSHTGDRSIPDDTGVFILSLDTELAWGTHDMMGFVKFRREFEQTRPVIRSILSLCERYDIEATWALVGHLFLDSCDRDNGVAHPDVLVPDYPWYADSWHKHDPCTDVDTDPAWYGADIVGWIRDCAVTQEIGCHTFSHVIVDDACSPEILESQIGACRDAARSWGIELISFVYPRDVVGHAEVLRRMGFRVFRGPEQSWYRRLPTKLRAPAHFLDRLMAFTPPTYEIAACRGDGIINAPGSMLLMHTHGIRRMIPGSQRVRQARLGLTRAARRKELFHLRLHPWAMACSPCMVRWLEEILDTASHMRDTGQLRIMTMGSFADYVTDRQSPASSSGCSVAQTFRDTT